MRPEWRRSSRSQNGQNCVEVAYALTSIRDSKNKDGGHLVGNVRALVDAIKADKLTRA